MTYLTPSIDDLTAAVETLVSEWVGTVVRGVANVNRPSRSAVDQALTWLSSPAARQSYSPAAIRAVRNSLLALRGQGLSGVWFGDLSSKLYQDSQIGGGGFFDDVWGVIKTGATGLYDGVRSIFGAGQQSVQVQGQVNQAISYADQLIRDVKGIINSIKVQVGGAAAAGTLASFWDSTLGKVAVIGGGLLIFRMFTK